MSAEQEPELEAAVAAAEAEVARLEAELASLRAGQEGRVRRLVAAAERERDEAAAALSASQARMAALRAEVEALENIEAAPWWRRLTLSTWGRTFWRGFAFMTLGMALFAGTSPGHRLKPLVATTIFLLLARRLARVAGFWSESRASASVGGRTGSRRGARDGAAHVSQGSGDPRPPDAVDVGVAASRDEHPAGGREGVRGGRG
jgi:multidrug efflux pump subunit AcrA (membrane-fusion protein)